MAATTSQDLEDKRHPVEAKETLAVKEDSVEDKEAAAVAVARGEAGADKEGGLIATIKQQ